MTLFDKQQLESALGQLVERLHAEGVLSTIFIVGGAALAMRHYERDATRDIDVRATGDVAALARVAGEVAQLNGWPKDWLNTAASAFIPGWGKQVEWETIYERDGIVVQVATAEALLAMKLKANRPGRDNIDIGMLMSICGVGSMHEVERIFEEYYPEEVLETRAIKILDKIFAVGIPNTPPSVARPNLQLPTA